ncbi:MAG: 2Fe-2S iron-sulfur cluster binding domain-containing protein, partial [Burkholderiales bacterium]|nr:2Fe-2S iron-sulfur cluster binding domain-containing protein [Burkholderiales bacterium]
MSVIRIKQWAAPIDARKATILDAALDAGVPYPHGCRSGECGACKCRLLAGQVKSYGYSPDALSKRECAAGLILACRSRPVGDIEIAWLDDAAPSPQHAIQTLDATVIGREQATHDITRLHLEAAGQPLTFSAGQYAELGFGGLPTRPYSMANIPGNGPLEFHIRQLQGGLVSNYVANELCVGDPVKIEGPYGSAQLRENAARPMLLVAGGSGLAPIKSILLAALALPWRGAIHLYHGVRDARDLYDVGLLSELASRHRFRFVPVLSAPATATSPHHGFV